MNAPSGQGHTAEQWRSINRAGEYLAGRISASSWDRCPEPDWAIRTAQAIQKSYDAMLAAKAEQESR